MKLLIYRYKKIAVVNNLFVSLLSLVILFAWEFDSISIKELFPGKQLSNPVTALCFLLASISFLTLINHKVRVQNFGKVLAAAVTLIAFIKFGESIFGYTSYVDRWLYTSKLFEYGNYGKPNYMAPNTTVNFLLLGIALLLFKSRISSKNNLTDYFALVCGLIAFLSITGYIYKTLELYSLKSFIPMAFPTASSFLLISGAILYHRSDFGFFRVFTSKYNGSRMARYLIPFAIIIPIATGALRLYGQQLELFSLSFGIAINTTVNVLVFVILIWRSSISLNKNEKDKKKLNDEIREFNKELEKKIEIRTNQLYKNEKLFRSMIENSVDIISIVDREDKLTYISPAIKKVLGINPIEVLGKVNAQIIHPEFKEKLTKLNLEIRKHPGIPKTALLKILHKDGHYIWMEGTMINLLQDENVNGIVSNFHDVTERIEAEEQNRVLEKALLQEQINLQKQLMQATVDGQEKEKIQIGMELHDNINQILASTRLYLEIGKNDLKLTNEMIEKGMDQINIAIREIRKLSQSLVPYRIEEVGVLDGINNIIESIRMSTGIKFHVNILAKTIKLLDIKQQISIYRIVQEQLNNILKHAEAKNVNISFELYNNTFELQISDDGKGFKFDKKRNGIGLSNIKTRSELLNGQMIIESEEGKGCTLTIEFSRGSLRVA